MQYIALFRERRKRGKNRLHCEVIGKAQLWGLEFPASVGPLSNTADSREDMFVCECRGVFT